MNEYLASLWTAELSDPQKLWLFAGVGVVFVLGLLRRGSLVALCCRTLALSLLVLALADPVKEKQASKREFAAILDASGSVSDTARVALLKRLQRYLTDTTTVKVFPFGRQVARHPIQISAATSERELRGSINGVGDGVDAGETNIGGALNAAVARSESSSLFILSDGFETMGNGVEAARSAAQKGVHLFPLIPDEDVFSAPGVALSQLYAPVTLTSGESTEVSATLRNTLARDTKATLELWLDKEKLYSQAISVQAGEEKLITVKTPPAQGGLHRIRAVLRPETGGKDETIERHRWLSVKEKSKILLISGTKEDQRYLKKLIAYKGYALESVVADGNSEIPISFEGFSSVIINNVAIGQLPRGFLNALENFVQAGGGALLVGGDRSFGLGNYIDTPLEKISPLKFVPPQTEKRRLTTGVALVIDKSGSMAEDQKIDEAREAALLSINSLKPEDYVGVIGFDAGPFIIIDMKPVADAKYEAERRLRNLTAAGKTNLLPALKMARERLERVPVSRKHIIVVSDGKIPLTSETYVSEINELRTAGITVSAIALGADADVPFMRMLSKYGRGAFYQTLDPRQLPQIFLDDIKVSTGEKSLNESHEFPVGVGPSGLRSTTVDRYPVVLGFVETLPKKGSDLELITKKGEEAFPMLASWRFGSGKVVAFTSDANGRWSQPWSTWDGFVKFWSEVIESVKDQSGVKSGDVDFDLRYQVNRKTVVLDLAVYDDKLRAQLPPKVIAQVEEPGGELRQVLFRTTKRGRFEGRIENGRPGDYKLNISYGSLKFPPLGITIGAEAFGERPGRGVNVQGLEELAFASSGMINPNPKQVSGFERITKSKERLLVPLIVLAFLLVILEAILRERLKTPVAGRTSRRIPDGPPPTRALGTYGPKTGKGGTKLAA